MGADRRIAQRRSWRRLRPASSRAYLLGFLIPAAILVSLLPPTASAAAPGHLTVNTTQDKLGLSLGTCSLREAIAAVDSPGTSTGCGTASRTANTIQLAAGSYTVSIPPQGGDGNPTGDLNVTARAPLTIVGAGPSKTILSAGGLGDRALRVASGARVTLRGLRIKGGHPPGAAAGAPGLPDLSCTAGGAGGLGFSVKIAGDGGGILNLGRLVLDRVAVVGNSAGTGGAGGAGGDQSEASGCPGGGGGQGGSGGGIYNQGTLTLLDSTVRDNGAGPGGPAGGGGQSASGSGGQGGEGGSGGGGGGIYNQGTLSVTDSTIADNRAGSGGGGGAGNHVGVIVGRDGAGGQGASGGGVLNVGGSLTIENSTVAGNAGGAGGPGGGLTGSGGNGGDGGGIAVMSAAGQVLDATVADNGVGGGGPGGSPGGRQGVSGYGGGVFVLSSKAADMLGIKNTIVASSVGAGCVAVGGRGISDRGHDLSYPDKSCPGNHGNPRLGPLGSNGGPTSTIALGSGSAALNRVPRSAGCPSADQRGVRRPQGAGCDIGAYEVALPAISFGSPVSRASYERGSRVRAHFRCTERGSTRRIVSCRGTVARGQLLDTSRNGAHRFVVTAVDKAGHRIRRSVRYSVWQYINPLRRIAGLSPERIDMGVDYAGAGPLLAIGAARVTMATDTDKPPLCSGITCWPGGGVVVYQLLDGPFAGRYVYVAENITVTVRRGQVVQAGQRIAILHDASPNMETGWASGRLGQTLAIAQGHQCYCGDPGGWSSIEGRNFNQLLVRLGAPSGLLQPNPPNQAMPSGWPSW